MPHSIVVDQTGQRFGNEAAPYHDFGARILRRNEVAPSIPSWLIFDARHRNTYSFAKIPARITPPSWLKEGMFIKATSLGELAVKCGIDASRLKTTVERFNEFARRGKDEDFGRGDQAFDRYWGDPDHAPNPNLGPIEESPFWAVRLYPGDIGTKGGYVISPDGQVLDTEGQVIDGLYACGNSTACVMGRTYPGAGGTIGTAMTFAYIAMRHVAGNR